METPPCNRHGGELRASGSTSCHTCVKGGTVSRIQDSPSARYAQSARRPATGQGNDNGAGAVADKDGLGCGAEGMAPALRVLLQ
jgi:hypothetical protein